MFDKLIESEPEGAEFRNRRSYFMMSSVVVGIFFLTAVVISIYAADYSLGNAAFELVEIVAPPEMASAEPDPVMQRSQQSPSREQLPSRQVNMIRVEEEPFVAPTSISTTRNSQMERPPGRFLVGARIDANTMGSGPGSGRDTSGDGSLSSSLSTTGRATDSTADIEDAPPPIKRDVVPKPPPVRSLGVINGKAAYLPKPVYSPAAVAVHAEGQVNVQVTIDESGKVISAQAVSGNVLLRPAAEQAARNARFTPTFLSKIPVKVTGVIAYNFTR